MDLHPYLQRINYSGPLHPDLQTLTQLQLAHLLAIPFENLNIHAGRVIELAIDKLFHKIVEEKRGGFCYELNGLYYELLTGLGFTAKRIAAQVHNSEKQAYGDEYDHFAIVVEWDGKLYLTDVGYGEFLVTPLLISLNTPQEDPRGEVYIVREHEGDELRIDKRVDEGWKPEYKFTLQAREFHEFVPMCNYQQYDPNSHFQKQKLISQLTERGRITLTSTKLKIKEGKDIVEREVKNEKEFDELLWKHYAIRL